MRIQEVGSVDVGIQCLDEAAATVRVGALPALASASVPTLSHSDVAGIAHAGKFILAATLLHTRDRHP